MSTQVAEDENSNTLSSASPILIQKIRLQNFLSFGIDSPELTLGPLNLLIGANGSGKSNLIEAIGVLRSTPVAGEIRNVVGKGGGAQEWVWKGNPHLPAILSAIMPYRNQREELSRLRHEISFTAVNQAFRLADEFIVGQNLSGKSVTVYFEYKGSKPFVRIGQTVEQLDAPLFDDNDSVLAQIRGPSLHQITYLAAQYSRIRLYREWAFGRSTVFREPQRADTRNDRLEEDFSNLGLFLNRMRRDPVAKRAILTRLRDIYEGVDDFDVSVEGGTVQVFLTEGNFTIPATRLSDGTLRYLCLLAILCDPTPPPLICIEEPELGLHPDILPKIADLLKEASTRTQLIVTTHSDVLVDAMTDTPEAVVVCEKHDGQTQMKRLSKDDLGVWLDKYRLGELWTRGDIGGTRW